MLFTRCPECDTTFRVTDETLKKASGQVRCGRCASVFNAYSELHDPSGKPVEPEPYLVATQTGLEPAPEPADPAGSPPTAAQAETKSIVPAEPMAAATAAATAIADANVDPHVGAAQPSAGDQSAGPQPISATEVDRVLTDDAASRFPESPYAWPRPGTARRMQSRKWTVAAALALLLLGVQAMHHFRSAVAGHSTFGPWITAAYGALGSEIEPSWDVKQYQILDWVATAEPNARGLGSLKITARIRNRGPQRQPYPAVQLRLEDRWEAALGSRMFTAAEYLPRGAPREQLMSPGETARAEIEVIDPGPDAYGFELDVCIEVEASLVTCGNDDVFR
jgi:predicted Zn finger-like uncharacterized protein